MEFNFDHFEMLHQIALVFLFSHQRLMSMIARDTVRMLNETNLHSHQLSNWSLVLREHHRIPPNNPGGPRHCGAALFVSAWLLKRTRLKEPWPEIQNSFELKKEKKHRKKEKEKEEEEVGHRLLILKST